MKILVADDSAMLRDRITGVVSELNGVAVVGQMQDWPAAVQAICEFQPDVVIMDVQLIRGRGITALRNLKAHYPALVLIVMSALSEFPYRKRLLDAGADYYLDKTVGIGRLRDIIQDLREQYWARVNSIA